MVVVAFGLQDVVLDAGNMESWRKKNPKDRDKSTATCALGE